MAFLMTNFTDQKTRNFKNSIIKDCERDEVLLLKHTFIFNWYWGGGKTPTCTDIKKKKKTYMRVRVKRASASETYILGLQIYLHVQSMQFPLITYGMALYRQYNDKILTLSMRASGVSELTIFF